VRCRGTEAQIKAEGYYFMFPRVNICSRCWTAADLHLQEERELIEDTLHALEDHLFHVEHLIEFYGGKGAR
jgi:hypothetical protein